MSDDGDEGSTVWDSLDQLRGCPPDVQAMWFAEAVKINPEAAVAALAPDLGHRHQVQTLEHLRRLKAQRAAEELFRASERPALPVVVRGLREVVEAVEAGVLEAPEPSVGGLLYPRRVNAIYGTHTAGKTWTSLYLAQCNAAAGGRTLFIDYEDSAIGLAGRCMAMGQEVADSVDYYQPEGVVNVESLRGVVEDRGITLVVIDSVGESLAMSGYDSNAERDVTQWFSEVPDAVARLGPAVLIVDHIAKKQDGTPSPVGSFRKSAAITGAQFALENKTGFSRERAGWSKLTCTKDRNGYFATGQVVGRVDFTPGVDTMTVTLRTDDDERSVTDRMGRDVLDYVASRWVLDGLDDEDGRPLDGRATLSQIRSQVTGDNTKIRETVDRLVSDGFLARDTVAAGPKRTQDLYRPAEPFGDLTD